MRGLAVGAPVDFRGVTVGEVTRIGVELDPPRPVSCSRWRSASIPTGCGRATATALSRGLAGMIPGSPSNASSTGASGAAPHRESADRPALRRARFLPRDQKGGCRHVENAPRSPHHPRRARRAADPAREHRDEARPDPVRPDCGRRPARARIARRDAEERRRAGEAPRHRGRTGGAPDARGGATHPLERRAHARGRCAAADRSARDVARSSGAPRSRCAPSPSRSSAIPSP